MALTGQKLTCMDSVQQILNVYKLSARKKMGMEKGRKEGIGRSWWKGLRAKEERKSVCCVEC